MYALDKWDELKTLALSAEDLLGTAAVKLSDDRKFQMRHSIRRARAREQGLLSDLPRQCVSAGCLASRFVAERGEGGCDLTRLVAFGLPQVVLWVDAAAPDHRRQAVLGRERGRVPNDEHGAAWRRPISPLPEPFGRSELDNPENLQRIPPAYRYTRSTAQFDLTVDQLFFEMKMNPWTVQNVLDSFSSRYSFTDTVFLPGDPFRTYPGGISFTHDQGVGNAFSPPGKSSYEEGGLSGLFSQMTHEQLVNWVLCAGVWLARAPEEETQPWLDQSIGTFHSTLTSLVNRDHPDPLMRDGIMSADSSRTLGGSEITTYDSLDTSLGQGAAASLPRFLPPAAPLSPDRVSAPCHLTIEVI